MALRPGWCQIMACHGHSWRHAHLGVQGLVHTSHQPLEHALVQALGECSDWKLDLQRKKELNQIKPEGSALCSTKAPTAKFINRCLCIWLGVQLQTAYTVYILFEALNCWSSVKGGAYTHSSWIHEYLMCLWSTYETCLNVGHWNGASFK